MRRVSGFGVSRMKGTDVPLVLKMSEDSSARKRIPLLPDDEYLPGKVVDLETAEVEDKFKGGQKRVIRFKVALDSKKFYYDGEPRLVSIKANLPGKGKGVHEKSNLYKVVCTLLGYDPWSKNPKFDIETIVKRKLPVRVMMGTSDMQEQEIENDEGETEVVDDYQYQWVSSYKGPKGKVKGEESNGDGSEEEEAEEEVEESSGKKNKGKKALKGKDDEEEEEAESDSESEEEAEESEEKPKVKKVSKNAKSSKSKDSDEDEEAEEEEDESEESEEEESDSEDLKLDPRILKPLIKGIQKKSSNEAGLQKVKAEMAKLGIRKASDLEAVSEDKAKKIASRLGIKLPDLEDDEEGDGDLSFLTGKK